MKKRILGLALALIMIISLLPLTTFAAVPTKVKVVFYQPSRNCEFEMENGTAVAYVVLEDDASTTEDTTDKKPVRVWSKPTDNYVSFDYNVDAVTGKGTYIITLHNFDATAVKKGNQGVSAFFTVNTSGEYDVEIKLEGTNKLSGAYGIFSFVNTGDLTITGEGSLEMTSTGGWVDLFSKTKPGTLKILNTTVTTTGPSGGGQQNAFTNNGSIIIENSTITASDSLSAWLRTASDRTNDSEKLLDAASAEVQITNSTVVATTKYGANYPVIDTNGKVTITNSSVTLAAGHASKARISRTVPYLVGNYSSKKISDIGFGHKDYEASSLLSNFSLTEGAAIAEGSTKYLKVVHECVAAGTDDHNCLTAEKCACGKDVAPAKTAHIAGANADDCTKDTICGNPGCTQVFEAKLGTAHVAGQDDGDCTTDILCSNPGCTQVATKGAENHKDDRTDCSVAGTCANPGCTHAFAAGQHNPKADDGDCTTDILCATCGKVAVKGQTAHKYTDKNDTTCDNAGCTNTRKVEGTENPKTGDNTALVLALSLMMVASAAFVCTKKFVR